MFCVVCGKETDEELRGGVCTSCYLDKHALVALKPNVDVEVCVHCHARKRGEIWLEGHGELGPIVEDAVREALQYEKQVDKPRVRLSVRAEDERNFSVEAEVTGTAEGVPFVKTVNTRSRVKNATCIRCSRIQGGYYEAIVQIRAANRTVGKDEMRALKQLASRFIERIVSEGDRNAFVLRDLETDGGLDVYMGTTNSGRMLAKAIATDFGGKISEHPKTVGQKDGLDLIRLTFAVRLPEFQAGDVVLIDTSDQEDAPFQVTSVGPKTVQCLDMRTGKLRHVERAEVERATVLRREDAQDAIVVSATADELQLMDPVNYATVSVLRPEGYEVLGETVPVVRHDGELIVLRPTKK